MACVARCILDKLASQRYVDPPVRGSVWNNEANELRWLGFTDGVVTDEEGKPL